MLDAYIDRPAPIRRSRSPVYFSSIVLLTHKTRLSEPKESDNNHRSRSREDCPKRSAVALQQSIRGIGPGMLGRRCRNGSGDGQADGVAELGDFVEYSTSKRLDVGWVRVGDDEV